MLKYMYSIQHWEQLKLIYKCGIILLFFIFNGCTYLFGRYHYNKYERFVLEKKEQLINFSFRN